MKAKHLILALILVIVAVITVKCTFDAHSSVSEEEQVSDSAQEETIPSQEDEAVSYLLKNMPNEEPTVEGFGGYEPSEELLTKLNQEISDIQDQDADVAFSIVDIHSGYGLQFNQTMPFYSASTIKGPYAVSLAMQDFDAAESQEAVIEDVTAASSNDNYWNLQMQFGMDSYEALCKEAGVSTVTHTGGFTFYSADELMRLWLACDAYLSTDDHGSEVAEWLDHPDTSAINDALGDRYVTWSKAGWYFQDESEETDYLAANDAGIVRAGDHPYVIAVMSDLPGELDELVDLIKILDDFHEDMVDQAGE